MEQSADLMTFAGYDIVGDVHGCYGSLCRLLDRLGYVREGGSYRYHDQRYPRQALFLGDLLDRGPAIRETVLLVQEMVAQGHARLILGNHEHHAVVYSTPAPKESGRQWLRPHDDRNTAVLEATLEQFANHSADWSDLLDWLRQLPLLLAFGEEEGRAAAFRVIHACWDEPLIERFLTEAPDAVLTESLWQASTEPGTFAARLVYRATSGLNLRLPEGRVITGRDGVRRASFRGRFWGDEPVTYGELAFQPDPLPEDLAERPLAAEARAALVNYASAAPPLFVGHYWLEGHPQRLTPNIACLDYSAVKGGRLVAYRMDDETEVSNDKFVWVDGRS